MGTVALLGVLLPLHQGIEMFGADGHGGIAACPVALDIVLAHACVYQFHRVERLLPKPLRLRFAQLLLDFGNAAGIVADNLAAAAAGSAIADAGGLDQDNFLAGFGQRQGGAQARQAAADNAGVGFQTAFELGIGITGIDAAVVIRSDSVLKRGVLHKKANDFQTALLYACCMGACPKSY